MSLATPLRVPAFRRLAGAYTISRFGDMLALVALAIVLGVTIWDQVQNLFGL
jgi:hypothetical protein